MMKMYSILLLFCITTSVYADCIEKFSWLPNEEGNISKYTIYYGQTEGGPYPDSVNVGRPASIGGRVYGIVTGLTCGEQYYFVCTATNTATGSAWSSGNSYAVDDLVSYNDRIYKCILNTVEPHTELPTNEIYWEKIDESEFSDELSLVPVKELASRPINLVIQ